MRYLIPMGKYLAVFMAGLFLSPVMSVIVDPTDVALSTPTETWAGSRVTLNVIEDADAGEPDVLVLEEPSYRATGETMMSPECPTCQVRVMPEQDITATRRQFDVPIGYTVVTEQQEPIYEITEITRPDRFVLVSPQGLRQRAIALERAEIQALRDTLAAATDRVAELAPQVAATQVTRAAVVDRLAKYMNQVSATEVSGQ